MMWQRHIAGPALAALYFAGSAGAALAEDEAGLEPYQMVRSLQLVQDRIASGDHAALPMQRKLLEMIDKRFRKADSGDFVDERNYHAMLIYAMSGGNPATIDSLLAKLHLDETDRALGTGIIGYLNGDTTMARASLDGVDPLTLTPELGAFFALVKGAITAAEDPKTALKMFDEARLLSPGTLVEEAALRRTIALGAQSLDAQHFLTACSQYVRRYLQSPYASQFADALVAGVVALHETIDLAEIDEIISGMDAERQKVIYLRLARRAAIDGISDLSEYASAKADAIEIEGIEQGSDPRALLYSSLATITSDTVDKVLPKLKAIDRSKLSESDRRLLAAAEAIAAEVIARPTPPAETKAQKPSEQRERGAAAAAAAQQHDLPEAEPLDAPHAVEIAPADAAPSTEAAPTGESAAPAEAAAAPAGQPAAASADPAEAILADARKKLDEIDKLLKETAQ
jgi:chemotaxis protein MotC